ncbi:MAG: hypothetical protein ACLSD3_07105 [Acutalibacteraceae bacterium]
MKQKLSACLLAALLLCGLAACAEAVKSPLERSKIAEAYAEACFAARMEAQGASDYTITSTTQAKSGGDPDLYQILIDYSEGGAAQTYSYVLRLEGEAVVQVGGGTVEEMTALLIAEAG